MHKHYTRADEGSMAIFTRVDKVFYCNKYRKYYQKKKREKREKEGKGTKGKKEIEREIRKKFALAIYFEVSKKQIEKKEINSHIIGKPFHSNIINVNSI